MKYALITGSSGLVGSEAVDFFIKKKFKIIAIDNNFRKYFFGKNADTNWQKKIQIKKYKRKNLKWALGGRNELKIKRLISSLDL